MKFRLALCLMLASGLSSFAALKTNLVFTGTAAGDGTGTPARTAFQYINTNLTDLDARLATAAISNQLVGTFGARESVDRSVNLETAEPFARKIATNKTVKVVIIGDSYADSYRSADYFFVDKIKAARGLAGVGLNNSYNWMLSTESGGAWETNAVAGTYDGGSVWFSRNYRIPSGGSVQFDNGSTGSGSDSIGVFWVALSTGGNMELQVSTNGGAYGVRAILDGFNATPVLRYTNLVSAHENHNLKVVATSGTENFLLGTELIDSTIAGGVIPYFLDLGGESAEQMTNAPLQIRKDVLTQIAPDLILFHNLDGADTDATLTNALFADWLNVVTCPKVIMGLHFKGDDGDTGFQPTLDRVNALRRAATFNHWSFVDFMPESGSLTNQVSRGWQLTSDLTHLANAGPGGRELAQVVFKKLGLYPATIPANATLPSSVLTNDWAGPTVSLRTNLVLNTQGADVMLGGVPGNAADYSGMWFIDMIPIAGFTNMALGMQAGGINWFNAKTKIEFRVLNLQKAGADNKGWWFNEGFQIKSNTLAVWPATPPTAGACYFGNSNGTIYLLTSGLGLTWLGTNKLAP